MACAGTQPTLPTIDSDLAHYAQSLGLVRLAAWYALERSTSVQAPLSTSAALTQHLFRLLEDAGVLKPPSAGTRIRRSLYEPLAWCYPAGWGDPNRLQSILLGALQGILADDAVAYSKLELWESLADAEIETYLAHQLRRHGLDPAGAARIVEAMSDEWSDHCLARRRYLAWCGTRGAATALLRSGMDQDAALIAMRDEMRRRSRWLAMKEAARELPKLEYCFMPEERWRQPILLDVFLTTVLPVERAYWTELPQQYLRSRTARE